MKSRILMCITAITLFVALAIPVRMAAQHTRYKLVDLGTLGGPNNFGAVSQGVGLQILNNKGIVTGSADTATPDPYAPNCANPDCFVSHAFRWHNGIMTDLGALPGVNNSFGNWLTANGLISGFSQNGEIDPLTEARRIELLFGTQMEGW